MPECKALTNQLHVNINGEYKPCCAYNRDTGYLVGKTDPKRFLNSPLMQKIKEDMQDGWHSGCKVCKNVEDSGQISVRQTYNLWCKQEEGTLEYLDLSLSNKCNLACRMCNEIASSRWARHLNVPNPPKNDLQKIVSQIDVDQLTHIKYVGGEPFVTPEIVDVLDLVAQQNTFFTFNTNLTFYPQKYEHLLLKAKGLYACYSIDGYKHTNDYIRTCEWNTIDATLDKWQAFFRQHKPKGIQTINTVVQALNFHDLKNIKQYAQEKNMLWMAQLIEDPVDFTINALPKEYIDKTIDEVNEKFLHNYKFDSYLFQQFQNKILIQDKLLDQSLADTNPLLYSYFE